MQTNVNLLFVVCKVSINYKLVHDAGLTNDEDSTFGTNEIISRNLLSIPDEEDEIADPGTNNCEPPASSNESNFLRFSYT